MDPTAATGTRQDAARLRALLNPRGVKSSSEKELQARIAAGGQVSPEQLSAFPILGFVADAMKRLDDPDPRGRAQAARDLAGKGSHSMPAEARLIVLLKDPDADVRYEAARALGDEDLFVRLYAAGSLLRIGQSRERALAVLEEGARSPDESVRKAAEHILQLDTGR